VSSISTFTLGRFWRITFEVFWIADVAHAAIAADTQTLGNSHDSPDRS
jgi:hypothetical protein